LKRILHNSIRRTWPCSEPIGIARAGAVVMLTALLCACSGGSSWRSSSATGSDGRPKITRSSADVAQPSSGPVAPAGGSTGTAAAAPPPSSQDALAGDNANVAGGDPGSPADSAAGDETAAAAGSGTDDETAAVQPYSEPEPPASNELSGGDAAADASAGTSDSDAPGGSSADTAAADSGDAGSDSAGTTSMDDSSAGAGAEDAGASGQSGAAAAAGTGASGADASGADATVAGGAGTEGEGSGSTAGAGNTSDGADGADSAAGDGADGATGAASDDSAGTAGDDSGMQDGASDADVAAVSPSDSAAGTGLDSTGAGGDSSSGASGELQGGAGSIGDAEPGAGEAAAAAEPPAIVGVVEAPGEKASSREVVMPQTLGGMLPLTIGVDGEGEFDFDKAVLREDVKGLLDQLATKLKEAEFDQLEIVGHTDRIGAEEYNQYLSERRAWAVARYLVKQGVPVTKLRVVGKGMYQPLTGPDECAGLDRQQLISCVQKDRRVEISASIRRTDVDVR
jgi:outer membrane protein OmpA-like peptidoglycan-associated protein